MGKWKDMPLFSEKDEGNPKIDDASDEAGAVAKGLADSAGAIDKLDLSEHANKRVNKTFQKKIAKFENDMDVHIGNYDRAPPGRRNAVINDEQLKAIHIQETKIKKTGQQSNFLKLLCAVLKLGKDTIDCLWAKKNLSTIFRQAIDPNLMNIANAVYGVYNDSKQKGGSYSKKFILFATAFGGMYNAVVKLGRFIEAKCEFNMKAVFNGLLVCAKILLDLILLVVEFSADIFSKKLLDMIPIISVALNLYTLVDSFIDIVKKMKKGKTISLVDWISAGCSIGSFICSVVGMVCLIFPGMGTALAVGFRTMQLAFDTIPTIAELCQWLLDNKEKVLDALKCMLLPKPNRAGHMLCKTIRDKLIGHDVKRTDNQCMIYNKLNERDLTVYTYGQFDLFRGASVAYWEETVKPGGKIAMAAGQEPNQPFKVQFEHPQITSWTGAVYVKFWARKGDKFYIKNIADRGHKPNVIVRQKRYVKKLECYMQWDYYPKTMAWFGPYKV